MPGDELRAAGWEDENDEPVPEDSDGVGRTDVSVFHLITMATAKQA